MTPTTANVGPKVVKAAIAVVVFVIIVMVVVSYWGTYRTSKNGEEGSVETTAGAEATSTPEGEASPEGGEGEDGAEESGDPESKGTVVVLIDGLNFRTAPSKSGDLISGLDKGVKLEYLETADGWYKVRTSDGKVGYVSSSDQYTELQQ